MITQTLQLNLVPKGISPRLYVTQYDYDSRTLTFEIYNGSNRFTLTSGTTAKIQGTKPDRHGFSYNAEVDTTNNVITADITQQMTAVDGDVVVEIVLIKNNKRIGTLNFVMVVQPAGLNDDTDTSDTDIPDIIAEATEQMLTAEAYAKGTRNGTAVTSGQTGYHDNSKYYKEQAATQASNASTSATNANTNALKAEGYAVGKQNGTTQTSGTYYHNNAQYYKEQAAGSATTASTKAGEASTSANTASQKASAASTSAQTASDKALVAEGYAKGTQNGTPVGSTSPYYHNNAEYFKNLANPTVAANVSFNNSGTDMSSTNVQDGIVENRASIQNLSTVVSKNGAKNVLPTFVPDSNFQGVSFSVNSDDSVTAVGTASGTANKNSLTITGLSGEYVLTGCPTGGGASTYQLWVYDRTTSSSMGIEDTGSGAVGTLQADHVYDVKIRIADGYTINKTFYPMLCPKALYDADPTYQPYAKTNQQLTTELAQINNEGAGAHNSIYRGKYLGASVTTEQYTAISSGKFTDLYIGDYWRIDGVNYRIGAFDYWYNTGDTNCTTHHVLLVPDGYLLSGKMNDTNTTAGGYAGSDLRTGNNSNTTLATARSKIITAFGSSHILSHREHFVNAVADGKPSGGAWYDSDIDLMNENMVYGTNIFLPHPDGSTVPNLYTIDKTQIKLFAERPDLITIRAHWWLRDVVSAASFAQVYDGGFAACNGASYSFGVRPAFAIC